MGIENFNLPENDPEKIFLKIWQTKANKWIKEIRLAGFPEELETDLTIIIEELFLNEYLYTETRDIENLKTFGLHFFNRIEISGEGQGKTKFNIFNLVKNDVNELEKVMRLSGGN